MSTEVLSQNLTAGVTARFGAGTSFLLIASTGPVSVVARTLGSSNKNRTFANVPAGFKFTADTQDDGFDILEVTSATTQAITISVGNDDVSYSNAVTVTGTVNTQELSTGTVNDNANVACANAAQTAVVGTNASRRGLTLSLASTAAAAGGTVFIRKTGGANNLIEMQPGVLYSFRGTYGLDVRNDSGAAVSVLIFEEQ